MNNTINNTRKYLLDHPKLKISCEYFFNMVLTITSSFLFAYGFRSFIAPTGAEHMVSGGASGISQVLIQILLFPFPNLDSTMLQSIFYFLINAPLFILSWCRIGKKFTIFTFINVLLVSVFINLIPESWTTIFNILDDNIARALFAGILTGLSVVLALYANSSTGGIDLIALYIAERKSTSLGKYSTGINATIVLLYVFLRIMHDQSNVSQVVTMALYTVIYFFTSGTVVDLLNKKNKKTELQIFTSSTQMSQVLIHSFPHGCTIVDGKGGYTGNDRLIIYMVVSYNEVKKAIKVMREVDPNCFVTVINTYQVYGKFYIRPIK